MQARRRQAGVFQASVSSGEIFPSDTRTLQSFDESLHPDTFRVSTKPIERHHNQWTERKYPPNRADIGGLASHVVTFSRHARNDFCRHRALQRRTNEQARKQILELLADKAIGE